MDRNLDKYHLVKLEEETPWTSFDSFEEAHRAIMDGKVPKGDYAIVRSWELFQLK